MKLTLFLTKH